MKGNLSFLNCSSFSLFIQVRHDQINCSVVLCPENLQHEGLAPETNNCLDFIIVSSVLISSAQLLLMTWSKTKRTTAVCVRDVGYVSFHDGHVERPPCGFISY